MWSKYRAAVALAWLALCWNRASLALRPGEVLDMSYKFDADTLYWPGSTSGFTHVIENRGPNDNFPW